MSIAPAKNPFPGLRPFTQEEDYLFFGREEQTLELLQRLSNNRFVAVVGSSGSGKSSLVRCGLLSELLGGKMLEAGAAWEIAVTHPGGNPLAILTDALLAADLYDREQEHARENLLATLSRSHFGLVEAVKQAGLSAGTNFLLVVDQFEELFRFHEAGQTQQEAANEFVSLLLEAAAQKDAPIYVVLTMRSDFIGECGQFEGLAEMVNRGEFLIPRLHREQYKRVIEGPIKVAGGQIAPRLLQRLLNDLGQQADQLPCLQHALMRTWDIWANTGATEALDLDDYQCIGRMSQALSLHADEVYESLASDRQRDLCRGIFQALTVEESNSRGIRRPQRLGRLCQILEVPAAELVPIIDAYRQSGVTFLMPSPEVALTDQTIIDISHESLMRVWTRLRQWVEEETQAAGIYHRLSESADLHERGKAGLYRDPELGIALAWRESKKPNAAWAERYRPGFASAMRFLEASQQASAAEEQAREALRQRELEQAQRLAEVQQLRLDQQQQSARGLRQMIIGLAIVAIVAVIACIAALLSNRRANDLAALAKQQTAVAEASAAHATAAQKATATALAQVESQKADVESSLSKAEQAEEAGRKLLYTTDMRLAPFVWSDDRTTAQNLRSLLSKHAIAHEGKPDLRGFEWHYYQHLLDHSAAVFSGHEASVIAGAFTPNGQLVTLDQRGQVRRWEVDSKHEDATSRRDLLKREGTSLRTLSPDGRFAALAADDKVVVFDVTTGNESCSIDSADDRSRRLLFTPDGERLIIVDDKIRWCESATGKVIASSEQKFNRGSCLAVSADGLTLAVVGHGTLGNAFSIFRLDMATQMIAPLVTDQGQGGTLGLAALSSDGRLLVIGKTLSGNLTVYDALTGSPVAEHASAHGSPVAALAFAKKGYKLATGDGEGTIKIWADASKLNSKSAAAAILKGHAAAITQLLFSSTDTQLVSTSADQTARVWDLHHTGPAIRALERSSAGCYAAQFSPDGQLIATADASSLRLWEAASGRLVRQLSTGEKGRIYSVAFSPTDHRLLAAGYGGATGVSHVTLWNLDAGHELARLPGATDLSEIEADEYAGAVGALAFSPDGKYLVAGFGAPNLYTTAGDPSPLKVWDVASRRLIRRLQGHHGFCVSLDFSRDGTRLASGSRDGTAIIWSTQTWKAAQKLINPDSNTTLTMTGPGLVNDVTFSPDGKTLAAASREGSVQLWAVESGQLLERLQGHSGSVNAVAFSPDGHTLASGSGDQTVRLWNVETRRELMQLDAGSIEFGSIDALAFSPDGKQLLAGGGKTTAVWSTAPLVWNDPARAAEELQRLRRPDVDFRNRVRLLSENLRLHEALAKLDSSDKQVQAAVAAAEANWHASRGANADAVAAYDRLLAADPGGAPAWLRTPGLLRLAAALLQQNQPVDAAVMLQGGAKRRSADGLTPIVDPVAVAGTGDVLQPLRAAIETRLAQEPKHAGLLELRAEFAGQWSDAKAQVTDYTAAIEALTVDAPKDAATDLKRLHARRGRAYVALKQWPEAVADFAQAITPETNDDELLADQALALAESTPIAETSPRFALEEINDPWQKLAAVYELAGKQAEIDKLVQQRPQLAGRIGQVFSQHEMWPRALEIYNRGLTPETTDVELISSRARAFEGVKNWDAAIGDWSRVGTSPEGAKLLAEFARRLPDGVEEQMLAQIAQQASKRLFEELLQADPANAIVADQLAELLLDAKPEQPRATRIDGELNAWFQLAIAYAAHDELEPATKYFTAVLAETKTLDDERAIVDTISRFPSILTRLQKQQADGSLLQWALASYRAKQGLKLLREQRPADAQHEFEQARDLFDQFLMQHRKTEWTIVKPSDMQSAGGATLTMLDDDSVLAGGPIPNQDTYTLELRTNLPTVAAIRLETMPDPSLLNGGSGRSENFNLTGVTLACQSPTAARNEVIKFKSAWVDHSDRDSGGAKDGAAGIIDADDQTHWSVHPLQTKPHVAILQLEKPIELCSGESLTIKLHNEHKLNIRHSVGRFRLSLSDDPQAVPTMALHTDLAVRELAEVFAGLAKALAQQGNGKGVLEALPQILLIKTNDPGRLRTIAATAAAVIATASNAETLKVPLDAALKAKLHDFAQESLRLNVREWTKLIESPANKDLLTNDRLMIIRSLSKLQQDSDLASLLGQEPLWSDVAALLTKANGGFRALTPKMQLTEVQRELQKRNPGFNGQLAPKIENNQVVALTINTDRLTDIAPVVALVHLRSLDLHGTYPDQGYLSDLSPLQGLPLTHLDCSSTQVTDLSPLLGMPLTKFNCLHTDVADLSPLQGMALVELGIASTRVTDFAALKGMPLQKLMATNMPARDLTPLQGLPLKDLDLHGTKGVTSLGPLRTSPLEVINLTNLPISDLSPFSGKTTLQNLILNGAQATDASLAQLKTCTNLTRLALNGTKVTQAGIDDLQKALPKCKIEK